MLKEAVGIILSCFEHRCPKRSPAEPLPAAAHALLEVPYPGACFGRSDEGNPSPVSAMDETPLRLFTAVLHAGGDPTMPVEDSPAKTVAVGNAVANGYNPNSADTRATIGRLPVSLLP